jgi:hypothetical protein
VALLVSVTLTACKRQQQQAAPSQAIAESTAAVTRDSIAFHAYSDSLDRVSAERTRRDSAAFLSLVDSMTQLESTLLRTQDDSAASRLFRLGALKLRATTFMRLPGYGGDGGPGVAYAAQHPDEYLPNQLGGSYVYSGEQWRRLLERFPESAVAVDAAWAIAQLDRVGECERSVRCQLDWNATPYVAFLERFPASSHRDAATVRINETLTRIIAELDPDSSTDPPYEFDPAPIESLLVRYDVVATRLPPSMRADAQRLTQRFRARLRQGGISRRH